MNIKNLIALAFVLFQCNSFAQLKGEALQDWVMSFIPACYKNQRSAALNSFLSDERLSRYCTCYAFKTGLNPSLSNELIEKVNKKEANLPSAIHTGVLSFCNSNYENYVSGAFPDSSKITKEFILENGITHRFTSIRKIHQNSQRTETKTFDVRVGEDYVDAYLAPDSKTLKISINGLNTYTTTHTAIISKFGKMLGIDHAFSFDEGIVYLNSVDSTLVIQRFSEDHYEIMTYILSKKLICNSLDSKISQRNTQIASSLLKEALIFAVRSYSGASYSYGSFNGTTSYGTPFNGNVTFYNNSWMGEHYSKGLDELFNGAADVSEINRQKVKIGCPN